MTVGVVWTTVTPSRFIHPMVSNGSLSVGTHSVAPLVRGRKTSRSNGSNVRPISWETRSLGANREGIALPIAESD